MLLRLLAVSLIIFLPPPGVGHSQNRKHHGREEHGKGNVSFNKETFYNGHGIDHEVKNTHGGKRQDSKHRSELAKSGFKMKRSVGMSFGHRRGEYPITTDYPFKTEDLHRTTFRYPDYLNGGRGSDWSRKEFDRAYNLHRKIREEMRKQIGSFQSDPFLWSNLAKEVELSMDRVRKLNGHRGRWTFSTEMPETKYGKHTVEIEIEVNHSDKVHDKRRDGNRVTKKQDRRTTSRYDYKDLDDLGPHTFPTFPPGYHDEYPSVSGTTKNYKVDKHKIFDDAITTTTAKSHHHKEHESTGSHHKFNQLCYGCHHHHHYHSGHHYSGYRLTTDHYSGHRVTTDKPYHNSKPTGKMPSHHGHHRTSTELPISTTVQDSDGNSREFNTKPEIHHTSTVDKFTTTVKPCTKRSTVANSLNPIHSTEIHLLKSTTETPSTPVLVTAIPISDAPTASTTKYGSDDLFESHFESVSTTGAPFIADDVPNEDLGSSGKEQDTPEDTHQFDGKKEPSTLKNVSSHHIHINSLQKKPSNGSSSSIYFPEEKPEKSEDNDPCKNGGSIQIPLLNVSLPCGDLSISGSSPEDFYKREFATSMTNVFHQYLEEEKKEKEGVPLDIDVRVGRRKRQVEEGTVFGEIVEVPKLSDKESSAFPDLSNLSDYFLEAVDTLDEESLVEVLVALKEDYLSKSPGDQAAVDEVYGKLVASLLEYKRSGGNWAERRRRDSPSKRRAPEAVAVLELLAETDNHLESEQQDEPAAYEEDYGEYTDPLLETDSSDNPSFMELVSLSSKHKAKVY